MRVGDIIRTPADSGLYGSRPAIVLALSSACVTVSTGKALLTYERADVTPLAWIFIASRRYTSPGGNRFRVCRVYPEGDGEGQEYHVRVGGKGEAAETRALEVRKLLFTQLVSEGRWIGIEEVHDGT